MFDKKRCLYDTLYSGISENKQRDVEPMSSAIKDVRAETAQQGAGAAAPTAKQQEISSLLRRADDARDDKLWTIAAEGYAAVVEIAPERAAIWVQYGHMLKEAGKREQAQKAYEKALEIEPENADTHLQLGHLLKLMENKAGAVEMYRRALEIDPMLTDAISELKRLGMRARPSSLVRGAKSSAARDPVLYFDITDLLVYFRDNRTPTGIQRISLAVTEAALGDGAGRDIGLCAVDASTGTWKAVEAKDFQFAVMLSREGADHSDESWRKALDDLLKNLSTAPALGFVPGSTIVNLGSPWGVPNYFVAVREAKRLYGVHYVAFVHDTIPLLLPEFCEGTTTNVYTRWIAGVNMHADLVLANAQNTKKDFAKAIARFSDQPVECEVVHPNGDFSLLFEDASEISQDVQALLHTKYALFVGTIEPRKNHLMVLSVWRRLLAELGSGKVPTLVFAGKMGWHSEQVTDFIRKTDYLDGKLKVLNDASDADLQALYQGAAFTVYNSHYEGWGLPVTESLSYGKVPVIARNSALTESGGKHAIFFDSNSEASLLKVMRNLLTRPDVLAKQEKLIASQPPVRPWHEIYIDIEKAIAKKSATPGEKPARSGVIDFGKIYWLGTDRAMRNPVDFARCEAVRAGNGWHSPEDWGGWTARRTFQLAFNLDQEDLTAGTGEVFVQIQFSGHREGSRVRMEVNGEASQAFIVQPGRDTILRLSVSPNQIKDQTITLNVDQSTMTSLAKLTEGRDTRTIGIGLKAFMVCREGDMLSRIRFMEEVGHSYATATAGVTEMVLAEAGTPNEALGMAETDAPSPSPLPAGAEAAAEA